MDAVTHPHPEIVRMVDEYFVPVRLESVKHNDVARKMGVRWLPGIVVADADERPAHVSVGFLPAEDLLSELTFGRAICAMGAKQYEEADRLFESVSVNPLAERAPEACFWWGISRFRRTKDLSSAREPWSRIVATWPHSQWARKVGYALDRKANP